VSQATVRIGGVFDGVDPAMGRPVVAPDHPRLAPDERDRVVAYLRAGTDVMTTTALDTDQIDPARGAVVPEAGFWSVRGQAPGRFERERLLIMLIMCNAYRDGLDAAADPEGGHRPMTEPADPVSAAIRAARDGDEARLTASIDWALTAAADMVRRLPSIFEEDRARVLASGLAELDAAAGDPYLARDVLDPVRERLAVARAVQPADAGTRAEALARLRVPETLPGLTAEQAARFDRLRERAAALTDVYVVDTDLGPLPLVVAADTGRLVLLVDD
jgi:hypothetical protein